MLEIYTQPSIEPLTQAEAKTHLRLDSSNLYPVPSAPTCALAGAGAGNVDNGAHRYRLTFVTADGETDGGGISSAVTVADKTTNGKVALTAIPVGGSGVTSRKIYRTAAGGSAYFLLATIADNTTTIYTDNIADSSLGAGIPTTNTTGDPYITNLISSARFNAENYTKRAFITQTIKYKMDNWPCDNRIYLPMPNLQSVSSITYVDDAGDTQTLASSKYEVSTGNPAIVSLAYNEVWPPARHKLNSIIITYVAGFGNTAADVPADIKQAMLMMIGHLHNMRESVNVGNIVTQVPMSSEYLLNPYVVTEWENR